MSQRQRATHVDQDFSNGYEALAAEFIKRRDPKIGVTTVRRWAETLSPGASILDLGCGDGVPIAQSLIELDFKLYGVDASRSMVEAFGRNFPHAQVAHEPVQHSTFFHRTFDGVIAWGLMFLLTPEVQVDLIRRVATVLTPGGRFLFTSPEQSCSWLDVLTRKESVSLGTKGYCEIATDAGLKLIETTQDEGENHYFSFLKV